MSIIVYVDELITIIKNNGYKSGNNITLFTCYGGQIPTDTDSPFPKSLAQELANNLNVNVTAAVGKVLYWKHYYVIWMSGKKTFSPE